MMDTTGKNEKDGNALSTSVLQADVIWNPPSDAEDDYNGDDDEENFIDNPLSPSSNMITHQPYEQEKEQQKHQNRNRTLFFTLYVLLLLSMTGLAFSITRYVQAKMRNSGPRPVPQGVTAPTAGDVAANPASSSSSYTLEEIDPNRDPIKYRNDIESILSNVVEDSTFLEGAQKNALDWLVFQDLVLTSTDIEAMVESIAADDNNDEDSNDDDNVGVPIFPLVQRYALMVLFFGTSGELWNDKPWSDLVHVHECNFMGVDCDGSKGQALTLDLQYRKLRGRLPDEAGLLTQLTSVNLMANNLEGSIPSFIYNELTDLVFLDLSRNDFTSTISSDISKLSNLKSLIFNELSLTGAVPESLKLVTTLEDVSLWHADKMTGNILDLMQYWPDLQMMDIYQTSFTGTLPTSIGMNTNLRVLWLEDSNIVTDLPTELGLLTNMEELSIHNRLGLDRGTLPTELGNLTKMKVFQLAGTDFTGTIPTEMGRLTNLSTITLIGGMLTGTIPTEFGLLTNLWFANFPGNRLTGTLPQELGNIKDLGQLQIQFNDISGTIPEGICDSPSVLIKRDCSTEECSCCYWTCYI